MTKEQAIKGRKNLREIGCKHYIYGTKTVTGAITQRYNNCFKTDEQFDKAVNEILADKWNVEILALHSAD